MRKRLQIQRSIEQALPLKDDEVLLPGDLPPALGPRCGGGHLEIQLP